MDSIELRASFRRFAGHDHYSKFVRAINSACRSKGRLLFWQEQLWDEFVATQPNASLTGKEVIAAFGVCDVHDCALHYRPPQMVPDDRTLPEIRDTPELDLARDTLFPFTNMGDLVCLHCRAAREQWIADNPEICSVLRCKTTYEDYCRRRLEGLDNLPDFKDKIGRRSAEITVHMEPGDELWEWDAGGWHRFKGSTGVAIIRNGRIVKQWCEWRS